MKCGLAYDKKGKNIKWGKESLFNKWCWENCTATCTRITLDYFLTPGTKINSKWTKVLNARPETIKLLEENIGSTHFDIGLSNIFLGYVTSGKGKKSKNKQLGLRQIKSFCTMKETINEKTVYWDLPGGAVVKNPPANAGDTGLNPGLG